MKILSLIILVFSFSTYSQVQVQVVDPNLDSKPLEGSGYNISKSPKVINALPDKEKRDSFLAEISESKKWDELQKDIFYMDLKSKSLAQLEKKYPTLKKAELKTLKAKRD